MAFQFKRDRQQNLQLTLAGDIDLEVTPDIKAQLTKQLDDARGLTINAANVSYMDSSGVSVLIIAMQTCKKTRLNFTIEAASDELMRVLSLAKLDKILPIASQTGPAQALDIDVFSNVSDGEAELASEMSPAGGDDDALIAALAGGEMQIEDDADIVADMANAKAESEEPAAAPTPEAAPRPEPEPQTEPQPAPQAEPQAEREPRPMPESNANSGPSNAAPSNNAPSNGGGGASSGFKPGTFS